MKKIAFFSNSAYSLYLYRLRIMRRLHRDGWKVVCIAPAGSRMDELKIEGFEFIHFDVDRKGTNPFRDILFLWRLYILYRKERYSTVFHYTIKVNIYGAIAAKLAGIPSIGLIPGLGYTFVNDNWLTKIVEGLYKIALFFPVKIFFLNEEDCRLFIDRKLILPEKALIMHSEGVNLEYYAPMLIPKKTNVFVFLFTGRILWDKGLRELIDAMQIIRNKYGAIELWLLGMIDKGNPSGINEDVIKSWEKNYPGVRYLGETADVRPFIAQCDVSVYPSYYREGIPRFPLEAMAMEKPIITTDSVGCRELIEDGKNGFVVQPKDVDSLVDAMSRMFVLSENERLKMGQYGREKAMAEFDEKTVIDVYLKVLEEISVSHVPYWGS